MLDKSLIGEDLKNLKLKCDMCGLVFDADNPNEEVDNENIDITGCCLTCYDDYGCSNKNKMLLSDLQ